MFQQSDYTDEIEEQGRILSSGEYAALLTRRPDIFEVEKEKRLKIILPIAYIFGFLGLFWVNTADLTKFGEEFADRIIPKHRVTLSNQEVTFPKDEPEEIEQQVQKTEKVTLKAPAEKVAPAAPPRGGHGSNSVVVTQKGIFKAIATAQISSNMGDVFGKGGYATGLDKFLSGNQSFVQGGTSGDGREGAATIGDGSGIGGSGWGGGSGGVTGIEGLYGTPKGRSMELVKKTPRRQLVKPEVTTTSIGGQRKRSEIIRVVRQNLSVLRYAYNKHLANNPGKGGTIKVKWAIDEFGNVLYCSIVSSNMADKSFEESVLKKIRLWKFDKINKPGDVTEVIYPFVFKV